MTKPIDDEFNYKAEVKKCKTIDDVMGKDGLIQRLVKDVLENILEGEIEEINMKEQKLMNLQKRITVMDIVVKILEALSVTSI